MISMTFLGIGLLAIAQLIPLGMRGVTQARVRTNAVQAGQALLDELRADDFSSAALTAGDYTETNGRYRLQWTITDNNPVPGMKRIDLTTSWGDSTDAKTLTLNTYVTPSQ